MSNKLYYTTLSILDAKYNHSLHKDLDNSGSFPSSSRLSICLEKIRRHARTADADYQAMAVDCDGTVRVSTTLNQRLMMRIAGERVPSFREIEIAYPQGSISP